MDYAADGEWNIINISSRPVHNNPPHLCVKKHYFTKTENYDRQPNRESAVAAGIPAAGELPAAGTVHPLRRMLRLPANANHPRITIFGRGAMDRVSTVLILIMHDYEQHNGFLAQRVEFGH